jgi:hypothetical protein
MDNELFLDKIANLTACLRDVYEEAYKEWDIEKIASDLAIIKKTTFPKSQTLSDTEQKYLWMLLCYIDPGTMATKLNISRKAINVDLSRGLYQYVSQLVRKSIGDWRDVYVFLEREGYKRCQKNSSIKLVTNASELINELVSIIEDSYEIILTVGSRARDVKYLSAIENRLKQNSALVYYRVLFGQIQTKILKNHLVNLLDIRDPNDRVHGYKTLHIGLFDDFLMEPERTICANEKKAIVILPSFGGIGKYDTALIIEDNEYVRSIKRFVEELYNSGKCIETKEQVNNLEIIRPTEHTRGY